MLPTLPTRHWRESANWVNRYAGFCLERSSISALRYRNALATYPREATGRLIPLLGLAPGEVCIADWVTPITGGLLHHRFTLTLTGGLLSVALSLELPRVGVTHHRALWSPDVPRQCRDRLADPIS